MPDSGALTSVETLSVSKVKSTSPAFTASPSFLCQAARIPDVMDSPTVGTFTSTFIKKRGELLNFEGLFDKGRLLGLVHLHRSGCRTRTRRAASIVNVAWEQVEQPRQNKRPCAHVLGFFLTPHDFLGVGERLRQATHLFFVKRVELLDADDGSHVHEVVLFSILYEVVEHLS